MRIDGVCRGDSIKGRVPLEERGGSERRRRPSSWTSFGIVAVYRVNEATGF